MPRHDDNYYDDYQDDGYDEDAPPPSGDEDSVLKQTPWFAISLAFHAVLLLIIWSIVISVLVSTPMRSPIPAARTLSVSVRSCASCRRCSRIARSDGIHMLRSLSPSDLRSAT